MQGGETAVATMNALEVHAEYMCRSNICARAGSDVSCKRPSGIMAMWHTAELCAGVAASRRVEIFDEVLERGRLMKQRIYLE